MSRKPTDEEKKAFRVVCELKRKRDALGKEIREETESFSRQKKDARSSLLGLLGQDECMKVNGRFVRRMTSNRLRAMKPEYIHEALMALTRSEVLGEMATSETLSDALISCVVKKINCLRRVSTDTISISGKEPPKRVQMLDASDEMKSAISIIDMCSEKIKELKDRKEEEKIDLDNQMNTCKGLIMDYMKRSGKEKQSIHIGLVDNIQRSFHISRKKKKISKCTLESAKEKIQQSFGQVGTLDAFLDAREHISEQIIRMIHSETVEEEYISMRDVGLREI
jgi:hypothetical protein